jgi:hypothetical protein
LQASTLLSTAATSAYLQDVFLRAHLYKQLGWAAYARPSS